MSQLRNDAETIWRAGVAAVDSAWLVEQAVGVDGDQLIVGDLPVSLSWLNRIAVVGAGKAGAGMAAAFEEQVGPELLERVTGWVNVPEDCIRPLERITLHGARPAGHNEPTAAGVLGSEKILEIVSSLTENDLCVVLLSGGGSALLPAPVTSLEDKQIVTRHLMQSGATINELNCVRKQLSRIKGGNLVRATRARTVSLIISDVIGDPLEVIASGPTYPDNSTPDDALAVLKRFGSRETIPPSVWDYLEAKAAANESPRPLSRVHNFVIGNNDVALDAAAEAAQQAGYNVVSLGSENCGEARSEGEVLAKLARQISETSDPVALPACILSGGEPIVRLAETNQPRKGGRNQELALAALKALGEDGLANTVVLSGGTDGEDGPTDAAGAVACSDVCQAANAQNLDPDDYLVINNSYEFFDKAGGLLKTGPTHTNVMDLRVVLVGRSVGSCP